MSHPSGNLHSDYKNRSSTSSYATISASGLKIGLFLTHCLFGGTYGAFRFCEISSSQSISDIKSLYFSVAGVPRWLGFTDSSYSITGLAENVGFMCLGYISLCAKTVSYTIYASSKSSPNGTPPQINS